MSAVAVINQRKFSEGYIFEMIFYYISEEKDNKAERYQWVLIYKNQRYSLDFIAGKDGKRDLHCNNIGSVKLDLAENTLKINDISYELEDWSRSEN